jgi:UDP-N-acetylglucosamine 2-epimerase (non-hydrolysing)
MKNNILLFIIGTRPELIKLYPIIKKLKTENISFKILSTGQHKDLLKSYWKLFQIDPDYEMSIMNSNQSLSSLTARAIEAVDIAITEILEKENISFIIAQGDTTSVMVSSMVAFYRQIPFAHIEAGLRSFDFNHPFPEEYNRRLVSIVSEVNFSPTQTSKDNLIKELIDPDKIMVVGNTVIDALELIRNNENFTNYQLNSPILNDLLLINSKICLVTCHRRENHEKINQIIEAIETLANDNYEMNFVWPVHPNPNVKNAILSSNLAKLKNVIITEPLEYLDLLKILEKSNKVISDSGGIQEEAPSFNVPVLILRETTERPEAVTSGYSVLVGNETAAIIDAFYNFRPEEKKFINPYGDGKSSERIVAFFKNINNEVSTLTKLKDYNRKIN